LTIRSMAEYDGSRIGQPPVGQDEAEALYRLVGAAYESDRSS
jgi:hypothetical protein